MSKSADIHIVPLDFDVIRGDLKRFLQTQSEFTDYNFEGSAMSLLIDILSYDAYYHGWYTNFAVNEVFLSTAQIRNSVVSAARQVGYVPRSVTGSTAQVDITIGNISPSEGSILLRKYTPFTSTVAGSVYTFYTLEDYTIYPQGNTSVTLSGVEIREGVVTTQTFDIDANTYLETGTSLTVFNQNTDTQTLTVSVKPTLESPISYRYERAGASVDVKPTSNVYFLFETNAGDYEIHFGDNRIGRNVTLDQRVIVQYLISRGPASSGANTFTYSGDALGAISETTNVVALLSNPNIPSYGGAARESIPSIKRNAPNIYQAQGRVVTPDDARAILLTEVSGLEALTVWGGEDHDPPTYGKMFICMKPVNADRYGTTQKDIIINKILRPKASPILRFETVDPDYVYILTDSVVRYSAASTSLSAKELQQVVSLAIQNYAQLNLGQFGSFFRYSQLSSIIDKSEYSIQSNVTTLLLEKRFTIRSGQSSYTIKFSNPLFQSTSRNKLGSVSDNNAVITVSSKFGAQMFTHPNQAGVLETSCWIQNEGNIIHVYKSDAANTVMVVKSNVGTVDFETGTIKLTAFTPTNITTNLVNELRIRAVPLNSDIMPTRDQIILLPRENIQITVVEDLLNRRNTTFGRITAGGQFGAGS